MRLVCLDTTILVDLERGVQSAKTEIERLLSESYRLATTTINTFEMAFGAHKSRKRNLESLMALVHDLDVWDFDVDSSFLAGDLLCRLESKGTSVGYRDVFIASVALVNRCSDIVTKNTRDFSRIPGIRALPYGTSTK